jgi:hypothetical protein
MPPRATLVMALRAWWYTICEAQGAGGDDRCRGRQIQRHVEQSDEWPVAYWSARIPCYGCADPNANKPDAVGAVRVADAVHAVGHGAGRERSHSLHLQAPGGGSASSSLKLVFAASAAARRVTSWRVLNTAARI